MLDKLKDKALAAGSANAQLKWSLNYGTARLRLRKSGSPVLSCQVLNVATSDLQTRS